MDSDKNHGEIIENLAYIRGFLDSELPAIKAYAKETRDMVATQNSRVRKLEDDKNRQRGILVATGIVVTLVSQAAYFLIGKLWRG